MPVDRVSVLAVLALAVSLPIAAVLQPPIYLSSPSEEKRNAVIGTFPMMAGYPQVTVKELEQSLRLSIPLNVTDGRLDLVRSRILSDQSNPKLVLVGSDKDLQQFGPRYDKLCSEVVADCLFLRSAGSGARQNSENLNIRTPVLGVFPDLLPKVGESTGVIYIFDSKGRLIWFSSLNYMGGVAEVILRTLISTQMSREVAISSQPSTSPESGRPSELPSKVLQPERPKRLRLSDLSTLVASLDSPGTKFPLNQAWAVQEAIKQKRPLLFVFWGTWCIPCVAEIPDLVVLNKRYPEVYFVGLLDELSGQGVKGLVNTMAISKGFKTHYLLSNNSLLRRILDRKDEAFPAFALFDSAGLLTSVSFSGAIKDVANYALLEKGLSSVTTPLEVTEEKKK